MHETSYHGAKAKVKGGNGISKNGEQINYKIKGEKSSSLKI